MWIVNAQQAKLYNNYKNTKLKWSNFNVLMWNFYVCASVGILLK